MFGTASWTRSLVVEVPKPFSARPLPRRLKRVVAHLSSSDALMPLTDQPETASAMATGTPRIFCALSCRGAALTATPTGRSMRPACSADQTSLFSISMVEGKNILNMLKKIRPAEPGISIIVALLLAACSQSQPGGPVGQLPGDSQPRASGGYKIGEPYQINGVWYYPGEDYGYSETGIASFYGGENIGINFHGRLTANGEVYDMNALSAAHQTLPMPSLVRVTNLENGRALDLRVNDRGPFVRGRIIDVSRRSAQLLGFADRGTARVKVEILAEESRTLKLAILNSQPVPDRDRTVVAAVPREAVASDVLPPPPGARLESIAPPPTLPPPASLLPPQQLAATPATPGRATVRPQLAAPIVAQPALSPPPPALPPRNPARALLSDLPIASLPVAQQMSATPTVGQVPVQATSIFVQAGAFTNYDNAYRVSARLTRYGRTKVIQARVNGMDLYRVRVGPAQTVAEADRLLDQVASVLPEARLVVD